MHSVTVDARMIHQSGVGAYIQNFLPGLIKEFEVTLIGNKKEINNFEWAKETRTIDFSKPIYSISEQFTAPFKIPKCDILLSPFYDIPILPVKSKKRVVIIHDVYHLAYISQLSIPQRIYSKLMMYFAAHLSDHIITISQFSKCEILKYEKINEQKISIVYFGFDINEYLKEEFNFEAIKTKFDIPEKYILFVSNIKPHKNLYNLLLALQLLLEKEAEIKLVVVGEFKKLITSDIKSFQLLNENPLLKNNTIFTGYVQREELIALYKNASAFIFPSYYEGFGIPPLEAMACKCPVIASDAASIPEVCSDAALYIDPNDIHEITKKIIDVMTDKDLANKLIGKGEENIKRFSKEDFSNNIIKVLNNLL